MLNRNSANKFSLLLLLTVAIGSFAFLGGCSSDETANPTAVAPAGSVESSIDGDSKYFEDCDFDSAEGTVESIDFENMTFVIDGVSYYADSYTEIEFEDSDSEYGTFDGIAEGDYVEVEFCTTMQDGSYYAKEIEVDHESDYDDDHDDDDYEDYDLEGFVQSIDTANLTLVVTGQSFTADESTKIEIDDCELEFPSFSDIRVGDYVKVEYLQGADDMAAYATEIEVKKDFDYLVAYGMVESVDSDYFRLVVDGVSYWADNCTEIEVEDSGSELFSDIAVGDYVKIKYQAGMDEVLGYYAKEIEVKSSDDDDYDDDYEDYDEDHYDDDDDDNDDGYGDGGNS